MKYGQKFSEDQKHELAIEFARVINSNCIENVSNTPDFIIAEYLVNCLEAYHQINERKETWYGKKLHINDEFDGDIVLSGSIPATEPTPLEPENTIFPTKE